MPIEPKSNRPIPPGLANNTHWNASPFAFAPNTNVLDKETMPSEAAARARAVGLESIEASKRREDGEEPRQLIGPAPTNKAGQLLPLQSWMDKLTGKNKKQEKVEVLDGESMRSEATGSVQGSKEKDHGLMR